MNKFMADFQVTNPSNERLAVTDITGHYMDEGVPLIETSCTCCRAEGISTFGVVFILTYNSGGVLTQ